MTSARGAISRPLHIQISPVVSACYLSFIRERASLKLWLVDALRTGIDLMNVFFIIEEYTDVEPTPGVREIVRIVIDAINNPEKPRPKGETVLGEITRQ